MSKKFKNKQAFALFQSECERWIAKYGLFDWKVSFTNEFQDDMLGSCIYSYVNHGAIFNLAPLDCWPEEMRTPKDIRYVAFHEVTELLIGDLRLLTMERNVTEEQVEAATHSLIHRLEKAFYVEQDIQAE